MPLGSIFLRLLPILFYEQPKPGYSSKLDHLDAGGRCFIATRQPFSRSLKSIFTNQKGLIMCAGVTQNNPPIF